MINLVDGKHHSELLKAQTHVWNHIFNFINSMSLKCAIDLGIPDIINKHAKPMTLPELIAALPIHQSKARCVPRLMRLLVHSGFFEIQKISEIDPGEGFVLTNASQLLLEDNPFSMAPFLQAMLDPILTKPWQFVSTWFKNDDPNPFGTAHGRTLWEFCVQEPVLNNFFNDAMASDARLNTSVLINEGKEIFEGLGSLVDVGGGTGTVAKDLAKAFPHLDCTVLDLPHVVADLPGTENLKFVGGDMFEAVPPADAVLLKCVLHDWSDEECVKILKKCKEAIMDRERGKVIIIDMIIMENKEDHESIETQMFFDMLMMILVTGQERNEKEWAELFSEAGFNNYKITPVMGLRSVIEVYP